jgi:hypothetical protein
MALGKSLKIALNTAYEKAFSSIFDAKRNDADYRCDSVLESTGRVRGFAIALTLGILASLFTALIVGRNFLGWFVDTGKLKRISMLHLISAQNINFLGKALSPACVRPPCCWPARALSTFEAIEISASIFAAAT